MRILIILSTTRKIKKKKTIANRLYKLINVNNLNGVRHSRVGFHLDMSINLQLELTTLNIPRCKRNSKKTFTQHHEMR
jgi:hypothetical protein